MCASTFVARMLNTMRLKVSSFSLYGILSLSMIPCEAANLFAPYCYFNVVVHVLLFLACLPLVWSVHTARQEIQGEYQRFHQQSL